MLEISAEDARRVLLLEQGLLADPERKATPSSVLRMVRKLGFVQLDSIPVVARAHDLTLRARLEGYRPAMLKSLIERRRSLFEHWTHDASVIPVEWYPHWRHRSRRMIAATRTREWIDEKMGAGESERVLAETRKRIADHGPLRSRDFSVPEEGGEAGWWNWKPHKAALEYLWWSGELTVSARHRFEKVYDLSERVFPEAHGDAVPALEETVRFACSEAIARLGCGTAGEIAAYFDLVSVSDARRWCVAEVEQGQLLEAIVGQRRVFAVKNFVARLRRAQRDLESGSDSMRLLAPFDPVVRDRRRALRLFGFDYRFEAYVPEAKRVYGYYVMPILQQDQIVGRCDLKTDRKRGVLEVKGVWWEDGRATRRGRHTLFEQALGKLAEFVLADHGQT